MRKPSDLEYNIRYGPTDSLCVCRQDALVWLAPDAVGCGVAIGGTATFYCDFASLVCFVDTFCVSQNAE